MEKPLFPMRINRYLAWKKHSTRKGGDELISKKKVFINGRLAVLGDKITEKDVVEVRFTGKEKKLVYFVYNKPKGVTTHSAQGGEKDIKQDVSHSVALRDAFPVGRLDRNSSGLLVLTNDGRITDSLLNPEFEHEKEYVVTVGEKLRSSFKKNMEGGVKIEGYITKPCKVKVLNENTFLVTLTEGKKHQIRRMCSALFQEVRELKRIRIMNVKLGDLPEGSFRPLQGEELKTFLEGLGFKF